MRILHVRWEAVGDGNAMQTAWATSTQKQLFRIATARLREWGFDRRLVGPQAPNALCSIHSSFRFRFFFPFSSLVHGNGGGCRESQPNSSSRSNLKGS
jgi:hypothetical protein